ncbi:putative senescence regulator S40 [Heracleum sosnowskyi]|uniref:Senescence regulator S40 n=1 Tax=Heracleum sosnowskyi TaxID=360622 RepID=A0AAD8HKE8_9APIA|nr:putative senescence regulator S40 [Heracleum sosnowskyi]
MADEEREFQEEEMWGVALKEKQRKGALNFKKKSLTSSSSTSCLSAAWHSPSLATPKMMIPKAKNMVNEGDNLALQRSSAPLKIPDWYNLQKANKRCTGLDDDNGKYIMNNGYEKLLETEDDEEGEDEQMIPPHEYIAKKTARTRIASHSMCEGVGRTLKGRDLCKLRNAILTQTGFLEE